MSDTDPPAARTEQAPAADAPPPRRLGAALTGLRRRAHAAIAALKQRVSRQKDAPAEEADEPRRPERSARRPATAAAEAEAEAEAEADTARSTRAASRMKPMLIYGAIAVFAIELGAALAYVALSARLESQHEEIEKRTAELEAKARSFADLEKRYLDQQLQLVKTERRAADLAAQGARSAAPAPAAAQPAASGAADSKPLPADPPKRAAAPAAPANGGNCVLAGGNIAATLKECIAALNAAR